MKGGIIGSLGEEVKCFPVVSDVDGDSQCRIRVNVREEKGNFLSEGNISEHSSRTSTSSRETSNVRRPI